MWGVNHSIATRLEVPQIAIMQLKVLQVSFAHRWLHTRFPFRYGIASMTKSPHVLVRGYRWSAAGARWRG